MFSVVWIAACFFTALEVVGLIVSAVVIVRDLTRKEPRFEGDKLIYRS
jgi:hypothetical protein